MESDDDEAAKECWWAGARRGDVLVGGRTVEVNGAHGTEHERVGGEDKQSEA